ncbi:hypothetical protein HMN09_01414700 [Mycena chlorophos]|uniref:Uncharacterized protein n=2 Tax=Mycena chlorophos TaxID=658473 RepID=A0A146IKA7_MYCCL|nr:hypothetical protein HMN09_01414700 [Mycena chlorophos]GAT59396.1 predicted protein [Mycena chlorophos]
MSSSSRHTSSSRRWGYFRDALHTASQNVAHKWKFQDFAECFPQYAEEDPDNALQTFNQISAYIENTNIRDMDALLTLYKAQENIDALDLIVKDAKARKAAGTSAPDVSTPGLPAASAAGGKTYPILRAQADRLRETLDKIKAENEALTAELENNIAEGKKAQERVVGIVDKIETAYDAWASMPMEDVEQWTAQISASTRQGIQS